jgi:hypothetical protein
LPARGILGAGALSTLKFGIEAGRSRRWPLKTSLVSFVKNLRVHCVSMFYHKVHKDFSQRTQIKVCLVFFTDLRECIPFFNFFKAPGAGFQSHNQQPATHLEMPEIINDAIGFPTSYKRS